MGRGLSNGPLFCPQYRITTPFSRHYVSSIVITRHMAFLSFSVRLWAILTREVHCRDESGVPHLFPSRPCYDTARFLPHSRPANCHGNLDLTSLVTTPAFTLLLNSLCNIPKSKCFTVKDLSSTHTTAQLLLQPLRASVQYRPVLSCAVLIAVRAIKT